MGVTVAEFLSGGGAGRHDFHVESEVHTRERMIGIEENVVAFDGGHGDDGRGGGEAGGSKKSTQGAAHFGIT